MSAAQPLFLVIGATGTIGSRVAARLVARGARVRALARDPAAAAARLGPDVEVARGDLLDPDSLARALRGVEAASLATAVGPQLPQQEGNFIAAAQLAGLGRVVKLSASRAPLAPDAPIYGWHVESEARLGRSGLAATVLRPTMFMSHLRVEAAAAVKSGRLPSIMGDGRMSFVDPDDVAEMTVAALVDPSHAGRTWDFGGPEPLTYDEVAAAFTRVLGRPVEHVRLDEDGHRAALAAAGLPDWVADGLRVTASLARAGHFAVSDEAVEEVLGRRAHDLVGWIERNRAAFDVVG